MSHVHTQTGELCCTDCGETIGYCGVYETRLVAMVWDGDPVEEVLCLGCFWAFWSEDD